MCLIKILVIGDSKSRNNATVQHVKSESIGLGNNVTFVVHEVNPFREESVSPDEYDLAMVDTNFIDDKFSKKVLGSGIPVLSFGKETSQCFRSDNEIDETFPHIIREVVDKGHLRDYIEKITDDIEETHRMISKSF